MKKTKDERVVQINNQIQSEGFILLFTLLALSLFIKTYLYDLPVNDYLTELILLGCALVYLLIRSAMIGHEIIDTSKHAKKIRIVSILGLSLVVALITGFRNYSLYKDAYTGVFDPYFISAIGITFVSSVIFIGFLFMVILSFNRYGQKRLEKKLNEEEE